MNQNKNIDYIETEPPKNNEKLKGNFLTIAQEQNIILSIMETIGALKRDISKLKEERESLKEQAERLDARILNYENILAQLLTDNLPEASVKLFKNRPMRDNKPTTVAASEE